MFHGNAGVERVFLSTKTVLTNTQEDSLIFQRLICDEVKFAGDPDKVLLDERMLMNCRHAKLPYKKIFKRRETKKKRCISKKEP